MMNVDEYTLRPCNPRAPYSVNITYSNRAHYGFIAVVNGQVAKSQSGIPSIGMLHDAIVGLADLTEDEVDSLHQAYLERLPKRDVRQRMSLAPGSYNWISGSVDFGPFSGIKNGDIMRFLGTFAKHGLCVDTDDRLWQDTSDARKHIIIFHELIHLQQDLCTGLGAWDSCFFAEAGRDALFGDESETTANLLFYSGSLPANEQRDAFVAAEIEHIWKGDWETLFPELLTEHLLEAEAVATTLFHLFASVFSEADQAACADNADIYDPAMMPAHYGMVIGRVLGLVSSWCILDDPQDLRVLSYLLVIFLCDTAFAVPAPPLVEQLGLSPWYFDPRLNFARLLLRLSLFKPEQQQRFGEALISSDFASMFSMIEAVDVDEGGLLLSPALAYRSWPDAMEELTSRSPLARVRLSQLRKRAHHPFSLVVKNACFNNIPPFAYTEGYRRRYISMPDADVLGDAGLTSEEWVDAMREFEAQIVRERDELRILAGLVDLRRTQRPFRCPFAVTPQCGVWTDACLTGILNAEAVPSEGCEVYPIFCRLEGV